MIVTNVRWDAVDARVPITNGANAVRQKRVVLTPVGWRHVPGKLTLLGNNGGNRARLTGESAP